MTDPVVARDFRSHFVSREAAILRSTLDGQSITLGQFPQKVVSLYLHHQVRSTFEIEAEMDVAGECGFDSGPREILQCRFTARADYQIKAHQGNDGNYDDALQQILFLHDKN